MKPIVYSLLCLGVAWTPLSAAFEWVPCSPAARGLGLIPGPVSGFPSDGFLAPSSLHPSHRLLVEGSTAAPYQVRELQARHWSLAGSFRRVDWAVGMHRFGRNDYTETGLHIAARYPLRTQVHTGLSLHLYQLHITGYGTSFLPALTWGLTSRLSPALRFRVTLENILQRPAATWRVPEHLTACLLVQTPYAVDLALAWDQDPDYPGTLKTGLAARPLPFLYVTTGFTSRPDRVTGGLVFSYHSIRLAYGIDYLPSVNRLTTSVGVVVGWQRR
ncbi:MAG: hypothetical protein D6762_01810 [Candidatus Neomarinimicrobiota bacterium]|nr:MAG: hypothetical protein D6762_01810 [Candidatus Neomarinimicrobiota bacterium]